MRFIALGGLLVWIIGLMIGCAGEPPKGPGGAGQTGGSAGEAAMDDKTFGVKVELGKDIKAKNVQLGEYRMELGEMQMRNRLIAKLTFDKRMRRKIVATAYDPKGVEYTQILVQVESPGGGDSKMVEFAFDSRLELEPKSRVVLNIQDAPEINN